MFSIARVFSSLWSSSEPQATLDAPIARCPKAGLSCPSQGSILAQELQKMQGFLPAPDVKNFDRKNTTLNFDVQHLDASNLSSLYDSMASSFWFSRDVQDLYIQAKGPFSLAAPDFQGTKGEALCRCIKMAKLVNKIAPEVMGRNLKEIWEKLEEQYQFPHFETPQEMREYLKTGDKHKEVTLLDLSRSDIEIIPPEVLQFPNLSQVILYDTKLGQFPHVLSAHSNLNLNNVQIEDLTFSKGTENAQSADSFPYRHIERRREM
ncbi:MAG: leucine-rich repeat domain-containing protein [Chlamydiales bacterium]|nr:leucine-rich repeat domain-containing protein [Chlamydiales bacterium]